MVSRFIDLHEDFGITSLSKDVFTGEWHSSFKMMREFEDTTVFSVVFPLTNVWTENNLGNSKNLAHVEFQPDQHNLMRQLKFYQAAERNGLGKIVRNAKDLDGKGHKMLLALEGTDTVTGLEDIHFLKTNGVRSIGLTWNYDTRFAAACTSKKDYGLTGSGEKLVELCNELNMAIDLGHSSDQTIIETSELSKSPVVVSHVNPKSYFNIHRNMSDEAIEAVVKNKGIIGLTSIPQTLGENPTIDNLVESITYVGENFGWDYVALGSDFLGITTTIKGFDSIRDMNKLGEMLGNHADQVLWKNAYRALSTILEK